MIINDGSQYFKQREKYEAEHHIKLPDDISVQRFLLGKTMNAQNLPPDQLHDEIMLIATMSNKTPRQIMYILKVQYEAAQIKATEDSRRYNLSPQDILTLQELYLGFIQPSLPLQGIPYRIEVVRAHTDMPTHYGHDGLTKADQLSPFLPRDPNLDIAIRAIPRNLRGTEPQFPQRLNASQALFELLLSEFNYIGLIGNGTQLRKSGDALFNRSGILALSIIKGPHYKERNDGVMVEIPANHFNGHVQLMQIAPINELQEHTTNFKQFARNLGQDSN